MTSSIPPNRLSVIRAAFPFVLAALVVLAAVVLGVTHVLSEDNVVRLIVGAFAAVVLYKGSRPQGPGGSTVVGVGVSLGASEIGASVMKALGFSLLMVVIASCGGSQSPTPCSLARAAVEASREVVESYCPLDGGAER